MTILIFTIIFVFLELSVGYEQFFTHGKLALTIYAWGNVVWNLTWRWTP